MIRIYAVLLVGVFSVSLASIIIKLAWDVPAVIMSTYRLGISSIILLGWSTLRSKKVLPPTKKELLIAAVSGLFLSFHFISWIASIKLTSIASSVTLVSTSPIFVLLISLFIFKEKQDFKSIAAAVGAVLGSGLIAFSDSGFSVGRVDEAALLGDLFAFFGALSVAVYFLAGSFLRKNIDTFQYITLVYSFSAIFTLIFAILSGKSFIGYRGISYVYMLLLALVPQLMGHTSFNWALKHLKANAVAISTLGEPIGASILAYLFFNQKVGFLQLIGMAVVLVSIFIALKEGKK
ncbi:DMT family transporter [Hippea maritima]|uniref:EamA domain-containing protein n=1 Tax=Hippea maritima (strain ATCC 700847 / DSM 10411 / MH2) TaxID=760142 RepID=F2LWD3_HIPMA|nr:DMT family transporter [Hippea maritima]AEA34067.1 protein of unknown function DUF6 transmembrane [Hippea maritima DSM 10411]